MKRGALAPPLVMGTEAAMMDVMSLLCVRGNIKNGERGQNEYGDHFQPLWYVRVSAASFLISKKSPCALSTPLCLQGQI